MSRPHGFKDQHDDVDCIRSHDATWLTQLMRCVLQDELASVRTQLAAMQCKLDDCLRKSTPPTRSRPCTRPDSQELRAFAPTISEKHDLPGMVGAWEAGGGKNDDELPLSLEHMRDLSSLRSGAAASKRAFPSIVTVESKEDEAAANYLQSSSAVLNTLTIQHKAVALKRRQSLIGRTPTHFTGRSASGLPPGPTEESPVFLMNKASRWAQRLRGLPKNARPFSVQNSRDSSNPGLRASVMSGGSGIARAWAMRAVRSVYFDFVVFVALTLNNIFIGIQADQSGSGDTPPLSFLLMDIAFCIFFAAEIGLRLFAYRKKFFKFGEWWNYFDLILVTVQIAEEIIILTIAPAEKNNFVVGMRILRILRLMRTLRVLRVIRFVSDLRKVVYLIMGSLSSFFWTMVLHLLLIYALAVFFTQLVADGMPPDEGITDQWTSLNRYFGSTLRSALTLYQSVSGGVDWHEVSTPVIESISPIVALIFVMYTLFAVLVLLNLVTGVFVDGAMKLSRADKEVELLEKAYELFQKTDADESGDITWTEFKSRLGSDEMSSFFESLEISMARADDLFQIIDRSQDGKLSLEELVAGGLMLQGPAKAIDVAALTKYMQATIEGVRTELQAIRQGM